MVPPELVELLVRSEAVTREQWARAAAASGDGGGLDAVLAEVARGPAWWGGNGVPGLTPYQVDCVRRCAGDPGRWGELAEDLAVNGFVLLDQLGRGGMGRVMRAWQVKFRRLAAVKRMLHDTELQRGRFEAEARAMMKVHHPNIARFYQYEPVRDAGGRPTEAYLIAMEYVPGPTGRAAAKNGLEWRAAARTTAELLDALAVVHARGFVHRDIKPENLIIPAGAAGGPAVKLLDMGATKPATGPGPVAGREATVAGTPEYMAPEMWAGGGAVVPASDLYALGGTLYFLLTGRPPYRDESQPRNVADLRQAHLYRPPPDPREHKPGLPAPVCDLVARLMSKAPGERGTPAELAADFRRLAAAADAPAPRKSAPRPPAPPAPRSQEREADAPTAFGAALGLLERLFVPAAARPSDFEAATMTAGQRLAGVARRPLFLLAVGAGAAALGLCLWRI